MPDKIPDISNLPYLLGKGEDGTFGYFGNGAVRRLSNPEIVFLRDEMKVRIIDLDKSGSDMALWVSNILFYNP
jgi:hypothetical protein